MKQLKAMLEKQLASSGFSKAENKEGAKAPFFMLGDFEGNLVKVEIVTVPHGTIDAAINALHVDDDSFKLHAIRSKAKARVTGKQLVKYSLICEYKEVIQPEMEVI